MLSAFKTAWPGVRWNGDGIFDFRDIDGAILPKRRG